MNRQAHPPLRVIESRRMTLVAATPALIASDLAGREAFAAAINAEVPENWPPPLYGSAVMKAAMQQLEDPAEQGWSVWYLLSRTDTPPRLLGICDFKGRPGPRGSVEISYSVLEQFRVQGYATEAVARLILWAFSHQNVVEVTAETLPHMKQSIRVMEKNGLSFAGRGAEHGIVKYALAKTGH